MPASLSAVADALAEMARVLAPGGLMILHILNAWSRPDGVVEVQKILPIDLAGRRALLVKQFCRHGRFAAITLLQLAPADEPASADSRQPTPADTEPSSPDPAGPPSSRNADAPAAPWVCIDQQTHYLAAIDPDWLTDQLARHGLAVTLHGDYRQTPYAPAASPDLIALAARPM